MSDDRTEADNAWEARRDGVALSAMNSRRLPPPLAVEDIGASFAG
jgi:hypothetical protein